MKRSNQFLIPLVILIVFAIFLGACQPATDEPIPEDLQIVLERGPCFGTCPVYSVVVSADGNVQYDGMQFVDILGQQSANLPADEVRTLYQAIESSGFFDLEDNYIVAATDLATVVTTVTMQGRTKSISHYGLGCGSDLDSAPPELCEIEALLEDIAISNGWISPN